jgi:hypothetical protein
VLQLASFSSNSREMQFFAPKATLLEKLRESSVLRLLVRIW